jgi:hypothetical protein
LVGLGIAPFGDIDSPLGDAIIPAAVPDFFYNGELFGISFEADRQADCCGD